MGFNACIIGRIFNWRNRWRSTRIRKHWSARSGSPNMARIPRFALEVDVDTRAYSDAHVPGAIAWAWHTQLCDTVRRDILSQSQFEALMAASGITPETTLVIYGDNNNWFAAWAFWQAKIYGHKDVRLMNGGRKKWLSEGREVSAETPHIASAQYHATGRRSVSARLSAACSGSFDAARAALVDVRSPQEFSGEILAPPGLPERASAEATSPASGLIFSASRSSPLMSKSNCTPHRSQS